jgi:hypothetical protein
VRAPTTATAAARDAAATRRVVTTTTSSTAGRSAPASPSTTAPPGSGTAGVALPVAGAPSGPTTPQVLDDTWILTDGPSGDEWEPVDTRVAPPPTTDAAIAPGTGDQTLLFGGTSVAPGNDQQAAATARTWLWDGATWSSVRTKVAPAARQDATMGYDTDLGRTVLVGGVGATGALGDTWLWDGTAWSRASPATPPTPRSGAAGAYDTASRQFVLFGGADRAGAAIAATEVLSSQAPKSVPTSPEPPATGGGGSPPGHGGGTTATTSGSGPSGTGPTTATTATGSQTPGTTDGTSGVGSPTTATGASPATPGGSSAAAAAAISLHRGDIVILTGSGFVAHAKITVTFHSKPFTVGETVANSAGAFRIGVAVPTLAAFGQHHFVATGMGPEGETTLVTPVQVVALTVAAHTSGKVEVTMLAIAVGIPVVAWGVLGGLGRRRRAPLA